ncbi:hypothetical protein OG713_34855 [Streptomyces sp. NBC_00723]|uniref:hypothetical protein n=1 Tax=Streptomyces sp. NBC_00723 TaxID=2903673 RepID=UPI00386C1DD7
MLIPASSTEYLHIPVTAPAGVDLSGTTVRIAVVAHRNNPDDNEWHTASWDSGAARILIGPDGEQTLSAGDYNVWVNVDPSGGENIIRRAGVLAVT